MTSSARTDPTFVEYPFPAMHPDWDRWHDGYRGCVDVYLRPPSRRDVWHRLFGLHAWMSLVPRGDGTYFTDAGTARSRRRALKDGRRALTRLYVQRAREREKGGHRQ